MRLTIIHENGPRRGTHQSLSGKEIISLGRDESNDIVFNHPGDEGVSGFHAEIRQRAEDGRIVVADKSSTNGVFVNGERVECEAITHLDLVCLGPKGPCFRIGYAEPTLDPAKGSTAERGRPKATVKVTAPIPTKPPSPDPSDSSTKKFGEKTVGLMIKRALEQAGLLSRPGTSKSTDYFKALVENTVTSTSRRLKRIVVILFALLLAAGTVVGISLYRSRMLQVVTTQVNYGDATGGTIARNNRYNVFLLARQTPAGLKGFCTGFAIGPDTIVTNAHCLTEVALQATFAIMNGTPGHSYPVTRIASHRAYVSTHPSPDIGVLRISGRLSTWAPLASTAQMAALGPGDPIFMYGFPDTLNREDAPEATFVRGEVGRLTTFDLRPGPPEQTKLIQHSAFTSHGTSGSPLFDAQGRVIGVNAGGYAQNGLALSGYNFGVRADVIYDVLPQLYDAP